jgi:hypothetical protein
LILGVLHLLLAVSVIVLASIPAKKAATQVGANPPPVAAA